MSLLSFQKKVFFTTKKTTVNDFLQEKVNLGLISPKTMGIIIYAFKDVEAPEKLMIKPKINKESILAKLKFVQKKLAIQCFGALISFELDIANIGIDLDEEIHARNIFLQICEAII